MQTVRRIRERLVGASPASAGGSFRRESSSNDRLPLVDAEEIVYHKIVQPMTSACNTKDTGCNTCNNSTTTIINNLCNNNNNNNEEELEKGAFDNLATPPREFAPIITREPIRLPTRKRVSTKRKIKLTLDTAVMKQEIFEPVEDDEVKYSAEPTEMKWGRKGPKRIEGWIVKDEEEFIDVRELKRVVKGEHVMAAMRQVPSDPTFLSFEKDTILEVLHVNSNGTFLACFHTDRSRQGLVRQEAVKRFRAPSAASLDSPVCAARVGRKESTILPRATAAPSLISSPVMDYVNTEITGQAWFMGELSREESEKRLKGTPDGTFLVRYSPKKRQCVVSISFDGVKHMVIENSNGEPGIAPPCYYLDEGYRFNSIVELINYYREHNLRESFQTLNTTLKSPYRECKIFRVRHAYQATEQKFLDMEEGEILTLIDTIGEERGWWKGKIGDRVGFFPLAYVEALPEDER